MREWYVQSYDDIKQCPAPKTRAVEAKFAKLLQDIYSRHAPVLLTMARGVWELRESFKGTKDNINEVRLPALVVVLIARVYTGRVSTQQC